MKCESSSTVSSRGEIRGCVFLRLLAFVIAASLLNSNLFAAPNPAENLKQVQEFIAKGSFHGGKAGNGFSILDLKRTVSVNLKSERIVIEVGDRLGRKIDTDPGYYHGMMNPKERQLKIQFSQLLTSRIDERKVGEAFRNSHLVQKTQFVADMIDQSTHLSFLFRKPVKVRSYTLNPKGSTAKIVIDITANE